MDTSPKPRGSGYNIKQAWNAMECSLQSSTPTQLICMLTAGVCALGAGVLVISWRGQCNNNCTNTSALCWLHSSAFRFMVLVMVVVANDVAVAAAVAFAAEVVDAVIAAGASANAASPNGNCCCGSACVIRCCLRWSDY